MDLFQRLKNARRTRSPRVSIPEGPETPLIRRRCRFSGLVQGVGFRYEALLAADDLALKGWVQNCSDGSVLCELEGPEARVHAFVRHMCQVPRFHISDLEETDLPVSGTETTFRVLYS